MSLIVNKITKHSWLLKCKECERVFPWMVSFSEEAVCPGCRWVFPLLKSKSKPLETYDPTKDRELEKTNVFIELDGVLAERGEWKGPKHLGKLKPGAKTMLLWLKSHEYKVWIVSSRLNPHPWRYGHRVWNDGAPKLWWVIGKWIKDNGLEELVDGIRADFHVPFGYYIGRNAIRFDGDYEKACVEVGL